MKILAMIGLFIGMLVLLIIIDRAWDRFILHKNPPKLEIKKKLKHYYEVIEIMSRPNTDLKQMKKDLQGYNKGKEKRLC